MSALRQLTCVGRLVSVPFSYRSLSAVVGGKSQWNAVLKRAADILVEVTDKQPSLVLHVYPEDQFLNNLDKHTNFAIESIADNTCTGDFSMFDDSDDEDFYEDLRRQKRSRSGHDSGDKNSGQGLTGNPGTTEITPGVTAPTSGANAEVANDRPFKRYQDIRLFKGSFAQGITTKLYANRYHAVVQLLPAQQGSDGGAMTEAVAGSRKGLDVPELVRTLNSKGYLILGAATDTFNRLGYRDQLLALSDERTAPPSQRGQLQSILHIGPVAEDGTIQPSAGGKGVYMIAVFKKW